MADWAAQVLEKGAAFTLDKEEYDYLVRGDIPARITQGKELVGFYVLADVAIQLLTEDIDFAHDDEEVNLIRELIKKFAPFSGKSIFLP
jgi:hypothetical protein